MFRFLLGAAALLTLSLPVVAQDQVTVVATKIQNGSGSLLASGTFCLNSSCVAVANGAISSTSTLRAGAGVVTVTNGTSTILTVPNVSFSSTTLYWDGFAIQGQASGVGAPYMQCQPGAVYLQTDAGNARYSCISVNGQNVWSNGSASGGLTAAQQSALSNALTSSSIGSTVAPLSNGLVPTANLPTSLSADAQAAANAMTVANAALPASKVNAASGVAPLDANKLLPLANLPALSTTISGVNCPVSGTCTLPTGAATAVSGTGIATATTSGNNVTVNVPAQTASSVGAIPATAAPAGAIVGTTDTQTLSNKTVNGVTPTTMGYLDATSSVQTQFGTQATNLANEVTARGTAVSSEAAIRAAAVLVAQHQAAAISPSDYGVLCNGQVLPIMGMQSNGNYLGTAVVGGTDDTAAIQTWLNALAVHASKSGSTTVNQVGVSAEGAANTTFQAVARFPYAAHCLVTSFPNVPEGVELQLNNSEIDVTTAAGNGPSFVSQQNSGQYYTGTATAANLTTNGIYARANDSMRGGRIVYAGPVGASTGKGLRVSNALNASFSDINVYGFQNCIQVEGVEYSHFDFNHAANCGTGFKFTTSWSPTTPGGVSSASGGITIDLNGFGNVSRLNGVDYWFNGASAVRLYGGTGAFASKANIVFGGAPPDYIDTLAMTGVTSGSYTASTKYPLTFTDAGGGVDFEGVMLTDLTGTPVGVWSVNGGIGMTSQTVVSAPACTTSGCTTPTITAHIATFKGMGDFDTDAGAGLNLIDGMDLESEGCLNGCTTGASVPNGRPSSGFQIISTGSSDGGNVVQHITNNIGPTAQEYTRFARDLGGNFFQDFQPSVIADPATGSYCQIMRGNIARTFVHLRGGADPASYGCDLTGAGDGGGSFLSIDGYDAEIPKRSETELFSGSSAAAPFTVPFKIFVQGETTPRMNFDGNGNLFQGPGGTAAADVEVGRTGTSTWGIKLGYLSNLPIQWQSGSGGNYSIPLTGDSNNFLTVYNRTTGGGQWYAASSGITFNGANNTFGFALNSCAQSSTKGVCTTPVNFFTATPAGIVVPGIRTGVSTNTDLAGQLTLASGTVSYTFTGTYTSAPVCTASDTTAIAAVRVTTTTTTLTIQGTGTDVVNYGCYGRN